MGHIMSSGMSARKLGVYGLPSSKVFDRDDITAGEALELAGLNFEVAKRPAFQQMNDGSFEVVKNQFAIYRTDTEAAFGTVGNQYTPWQNEAAFAMVDELLGYGAVIDVATSWNNGADVVISAQLQNGIKVEGEEDVDLHLMVRNNHAGKGAVSAYVTPVRFNCTNVLRSAVGSAVSSWKVRHTSTVSDRIQEATTALRLVDTYAEELGGAIKQLQETEMSSEEFDNFLLEVTEAERVRKSIRETYDTSETVTRGNRWGAFNALTEAIQWNSPRQTAIETRFASEIDGPQARTRDRGMRLLLNR